MYNYKGKTDQRGGISLLTSCEERAEVLRKLISNSSINTDDLPVSWVDKVFFNGIIINNTIYKFTKIRSHFVKDILILSWA